MDQVIEGFRKLSTAVVADVFRFSSYYQQVMDPAIQPLLDGWKLCGRALTQSNLPRRKNEPALFEDAEAVMQPGNVVVESYWGAWGLNYAVGAKARGCVGGVIDGPHRDLPTHRTELADFPVFFRRGLPDRSANPGGSHRAFRTRWMNAVNVPINCGGVRVDPNDIILGDDDGVVVVPRNIEADILRFAESLEVAEHQCAAAKGSLKGDKEAHEFISRWQKETGIIEWGRAQNV